MSNLENKCEFDLNIRNIKNSIHDTHDQNYPKNQIKSDCQSEISIGAQQIQFIQNNDNKKDLRPSKKRNFHDLQCQDLVDDKTDLEDELMSIATNNSESGQSEMCQQSSNVNEMSQIQQSLYFTRKQKPFKIQRKMSRPR